MKEESACSDRKELASYQCSACGRVYGTLNALTMPPCWCGNKGWRWVAPNTQPKPKQLDLFDDFTPGAFPAGDPT